MTDEERQAEAEYRVRLEQASVRVEFASLYGPRSMVAEAELELEKVKAERQ